jgi:vancomycin resistance protein YoaR
LAGGVLRISLNGDKLAEGLRLDGMALAGDGDLSALLDTGARELAERELEVVVDGVPDLRRSFALGELGVALDVARLSMLARAVGHSGSLIDRFLEARRARHGEIDLPRTIRVDAQVAQAALQGLKDEVDELPVAARLDLAHGGIIPEVPGQFLDIDDALEQIRAAALSGAATIALRRIEHRPRVSREFLEQVAIGMPLSRFQTWFSRKGEQENRARNIDRAAAQLDGVVLLPGELFSFNAVVGPRTPDNGFSKGWEIFKGEMVEGVGGGTCQVASTFHAAALLAGLDIIERLPHSRPSAYITMGLDATVVYPIVDLKLRNPYDFPIVVHGWVEGGMVAFELLGRERPARVTFGREVLATRPFVRKVDEKPGILPDRAIRKQHGIRGYKILRTRIIAFRDGTSRRESNIDFYPPTTEMYLVAPGADPEALLPPFNPGPDPLAPPSEQSPAPGAVSTSGSTISASALSPSPAGAGILPAAAASSGAASPNGAGGATSAGVPPSTSGAGTVSAPSSSAEAPAPEAHITAAPGVHAPRAEQLIVPKKVVIHSLPAHR